MSKNKKVIALRETDEYKNEIKLIESKEYLASTDWYMARKVETGEDVPYDIIQKRVEARNFIRTIEG